MGEFKAFDAKYRRYFSQLAGRSQGPIIIHGEKIFICYKLMLNELNKAGHKRYLHSRDAAQGKCENP
jgi:hypothetical protein